MTSRQSSRKPIPRIWLMTDPRLDPRLCAAVRRLPQGSGVVFRHYALPVEERQRLFDRIRRICRQRGHMLLLAGDPLLARQWKADGAHGRGKARFCSAPVHGPREITEAKRNRTEILFLSPVRSTRSHPGARPLGAARFHQLALFCHPAKVIALGGMNRAQAAKWRPTIVHGWAAIDAFNF